MILCDAGPLIALVDADDPNHERCMAILPTLAVPLLTTWPCMAEAMYLVWRGGGWRGQESLWQYMVRGAMRLHSASEEEWMRIRELMAKYKDVPMDFADASLVAAAETTNQRRIFTIDSHFWAYRINDKHPFEVVP